MLYTNSIQMPPPDAFDLLQTLPPGWASKGEVCLVATPIGRERDISLRFDCSQPLGQGVRDGIVCGAARRKAKCRPCTVSGGNHGIDFAPSIALDDKASHGNSPVHRTSGRILPAGVFFQRAYSSGGRILIDVRRRGAHQAPKLVAVGTGFDDNEVNSQGRDFLSGRFDEAFDAPFGCVIQAEGRVRDLAAFGRDLNNSPPPC
jgi:hypothetical protein